MHEDNFYDDEDLINEDGDFIPDDWDDFDEDDDIEIEDKLFSEEIDDDFFEDDELTEEEDFNPMECNGLVQDEEGNWCYPEDLE